VQNYELEKKNNMSRNKLITEEQEPVQEQPEKPKKDKKKRASTGFSIGKILSRNLSDDLVFRNLPFIFFISFLIFLYIMITNETEKKLGKIESIKNEIKELRTRRINMANVYSSVKKQSSVAQRLDSLKTGIKESKVQPKFIEVTAVKSK
jgi:hypothetical protein